MIILLISYLKKEKLKQYKITHFLLLQKMNGVGEIALKKKNILLDRNRINIKINSEIYFIIKKLF